jgi:hypothetical protein
MHYTINGAEPTESDPVIASGGTLVAGNFTLKAKTWKTGTTASATTSAAYSVTGDVTPPAIAAGGEHYSYVDNDAIGSMDPLGLTKNKVGGVKSDCNWKDREFCKVDCKLRGFIGVTNCYVFTWSKLTRQLTNPLKQIRRTVRTVECDCEEPPLCEMCKKVPVFVAMLGAILLMCVTRGRAPAPAW